MSVSGAGDTPLIPVERDVKSHKPSRKGKADDLKAKIPTNEPVPKKSHKISKKSKKGKTHSFKSEAKAIGFKHNKDQNMYQSILEPKKLISIDEMEALVHQKKDPALLIPDVFSQVLSHLDSYEIATAKSVSKTWSQLEPTAAINREAALLNPYFELLNLDSAERGPILAAKTLKELQTHLLALREKVVILAKGLNVDNLKKLKELKPPLFFDKIIALIPIYKDIDALDKLTDWEKPGVLLAITRSLCQLGCFEKSIELAGSFKDDEALQMSFLEAIKKLPFDRVINLANSIRDGVARENALLNLTRALSEAGKLDLAKVVASSINLDTKIRVQALREIAAAEKKG